MRNETMVSEKNDGARVFFFLTWARVSGEPGAAEAAETTDLI